MPVFIMPTRLVLAAVVGALVAPMASAEEKRQFDILEFRIDGNTLLPVALLEEAVMPFLGPGRTVDDVEKARAALDILYAKHGYPTAAADIPEQDPSDGVIQLRVVERRVGRLRVVGARYFSPGDIRAAVPSLAAGEVPNLNAVQKEIVALNQWPDRQVTPVLRPGVKPGTIDVDLNVKDTLPAQASLEFTNRRSANTTALRGSASLSYGNLWQRGDAASISYQFAPQRFGDTAVMSVTYLHRIGNGGMALLFSYLNSDSNVTTLGGTGVVGKGEVYGLRLQVPLGTEGPFNHSLSVGLDVKSFRDTILLGADRSVTPVTYVPLVAQYQASWLEKQSETLASGTMSLGTRGLGSDAAAFDLKRYQAKPDFALVKGDITRRDDWPRGWQTSLRLTGQIAGEPLISNEQFAIGGVDSVRGYLESEALGDWGYAAQTELRGPAFTDLVWAGNDVRPFSFADTGRAGSRDTLPGQRRGYALSSAGVGMRMRLFDAIGLDLTGANLLASGTGSRAGAGRFLFRVNGSL